MWVLYHQLPLLKSVLGLAAELRPPAPGFSLRPEPLLGLPHVVTLSLTGGVLGILLAALIRYARLPDFLTGVLLGALGWTLLDLGFLATLRGEPAWAGGHGPTWLRVILANSAWGWGTVLLLRPVALRG